jgi:predicted CoA-substrate-specific enzyme activase
MIVAGVDVGSTVTKSVVMDEECAIVARGIVPTGAKVVKAAESALDTALAESGQAREEVAFTVGTGYGRYAIPFGDIQVTEISCHARGAAFLFPGTRTVLDIGGQDTKGIKIDARGEVVDFSMNDKCAAGTGRFLAAAAEVMGLSLDEMGEASLRSQRPLKITNVCTVFVESEIMALLARGKAIDDILGGVHNAIAIRSIGLLRRVGIDEELTFTGGVARNVGMVKALQRKLNVTINVGPDSQFIGAIGAALFARERAVAQEPQSVSEDSGPSRKSGESRSISGKSEANSRTI